MGNKINVNSWRITLLDLHLHWQNLEISSVVFWVVSVFKAPDKEGIYESETDKSLYKHAKEIKPTFKKERKKAVASNAVQIDDLADNIYQPSFIRFKICVSWLVAVKKIFCFNVIMSLNC